MRKRPRGDAGVAKEYLEIGNFAEAVTQEGECPTYIVTPSW